MRQYELDSKQCRIHIVLVQFYVEPSNDFNLLYFSKVSELSLCSFQSFLNLSSARLLIKWFLT